MAVPSGGPLARQIEADSAVIAPVGFVIDLVKPVESNFLVRRINTKAGVLDGDFNAFIAQARRLIVPDSVNFAPLFRADGRGSVSTSRDGRHQRRLMVIVASEQDRFVLEQLWQGLRHLVAHFRRSNSQSASATLPESSCRISSSVAIYLG